jgi:hypothetical protein
MNSEGCRLPLLSCQGGVYCYCTTLIIMGVGSAWRVFTPCVPCDTSFGHADTRIEDHTQTAGGPYPLKSFRPI